LQPAIPIAPAFQRKLNVGGKLKGEIENIGVMDLTVGNG